MRLAHPRPQPSAPSPAPTRPLAQPPEWALAQPRLPQLGACPQSPVPTLDGGFFFPRTPHPTPNRRSLKNIFMRLRRTVAVRATVVRARGLWKLLSRARGQGRRPWPSGHRGFGMTLRGPGMASGLRRAASGVRPPRHYRRPRRLRLYRKPRRRTPLRPRRRQMPPANRAPVLRLSAKALRLRIRRRARRRDRALLRRPGIGVVTGSLPLPRLPTTWAKAPRLVHPPRPRGWKPARRMAVQVRYKPGLSKAWRLLRSHFCLAWGLSWARQRRLTRFVSQLQGLNGAGFVQMCVGGLGALVKESGLAPGQHIGLGAWVNGRLVRSPFFQLYRGDRVSLGLVGRGAGRTLEWSSHIKTAPMPFWEVDGLTRSVTVVADPDLGLGLRRPQLGRPMPFLTFRMYNWKYRH